MPSSSKTSDEARDGLAEAVVALQGTVAQHECEVGKLRKAVATLDAPLPNIQQLPLAITAVRKLDPSQLDSHE